MAESRTSRGGSAFDPKHRSTRDAEGAAAIREATRAPQRAQCGGRWRWGEPSGGGSGEEQLAAEKIEAARIAALQAAERRKLEGNFGGFASMRGTNLDLLKQRAGNVAVAGAGGFGAAVQLWAAPRIASSRTDLLPGPSGERGAET